MYLYIYNNKHIQNEYTHILCKQKLLFWMLTSSTITKRTRIVGYQRQWRIHPCCLQKSIRWRYLMRQELKLILDSDVPWCLPSLECSEGSIFQFSDVVPVFLSVSALPCLALPLFGFIKDCYFEIYPRFWPQDSTNQYNSPAVILGESLATLLLTVH